MMEIALTIGIYAGIGLLTCLVFSFRKGRNPNAIKAIQLFGVDYNPFLALLFVILWPLWLILQVIEQDMIEPSKASPQENKTEDLETLVGRIGKTLTPMVPSGKVRVGEKDYEALSEDGKLDREQEVEVLSVSMGTLKVRTWRASVTQNRDVSEA